MELQRNKIVNLKLAVDKLDGVVLYPGETFSYWRLIGKPTRKKGYLEGMVLFWGVLAVMWAAACAYPHRDLMIRNDTDQAFQLCLQVGGDPFGGSMAGWEAAGSKVQNRGEGRPDGTGLLGRLHLP